MMRCAFCNTDMADATKPGGYRACCVMPDAEGRRHGAYWYEDKIYCSLALTADMKRAMQHAAGRKLGRKDFAASAPEAWSLK